MVGVKLKPAAIDRSTVTFGDSLNMTATAAASDVKNPHETSIAQHYRSIKDTLDGGIPDEVSFGYMEAQIHGGVKLQDIESVTFFGGARNLSKAEFSRITKALDSAGIPWIVDTKRN